MLVLGALIGDQAAAVIRYHPHQYVYFNRFIGGLAGADGLYSTDYYAGSYKDAARSLPEELWASEPETYLESVYRIGGCIGQFRALRNLPGNFVYQLESDAPYDFDISFTRGDCHLKKAEHPEFSRVERDGGLLTLVRDMRRVILPRDELRKLRKLEKAELRRQELRKSKGKKKRKPKKPKAGGRRPQPAKAPKPVQPKE